MIQNIQTNNLVLPGGGGAGRAPTLCYTLAFTLQLRKITENLSQGIMNIAGPRALLRTAWPG
jgi:hypothetical protein